jgi:hypothetical protein
MYVAARIPLAGLVSHRAGAVHLTEPEAAPAAGAADCSGWTSFGAAAQAEKIVRVERDTIEMQLKIRFLFKSILLLQNCSSEIFASQRHSAPLRSRQARQPSGK